MSTYLIKLSDTHYKLQDHADGFDCNFRNHFLDQITTPSRVDIEYIPDDTIRAQYPLLDLRFDFNHVTVSFETLRDYQCHPDLDYKNFMCSFNGYGHVGRKLLTAAIHKFGWFDPMYISKNFKYTVDEIDGHLFDEVGTNDRFYRKFFIGENSQEFFQTTNGFGYVQADHPNNIYTLENKLVSSFVHLVSETGAVRHYPFATEKHIYSIVTRGLFLAYAQPGWHAQLVKYFGFQLYTKLFDYSFDSIKNPIERLIALMSMLSKFKNLSPADWRDLYEMERDAIEYNYEHFFSKNYLKELEQFR
jgi:hypothetical protein